MRVFAVGALAVLCAACGTPPEPAPPSSSPTARTVEINPARIERARDRLPEGYEVAGYSGSPAPITLWGFGDAADSEPPQCGALSAPVVDPATTRGWSASGPGGIVYAVVSRAGPPETPAAVLLAECPQWTVSSGHTTGTVSGRTGPAVDAAQTVAMSTAATTVVEGGTETRSHAETFIAYLDGHVCLVAVVTDPGSPYPALDADFAAGLLTAAVSSLRG